MFKSGIVGSFDPSNEIILIHMSDHTVAERMTILE